MKPKLNVLIAEPSDIIRQGLMSLIGDEEFAFLAPLRDLSTDLPQRIPHLQPDIFILNPTLLQSPATIIDIREQGSKVPQLLRECCQNVDDTTEENYDLSDRESEVLVLVAQGNSSKEIADKLNISIHTVNTHRKNITHKTGIKSVAGLAVYAMLHNLV